MRFVYRTSKSSFLCKSHSGVSLTKGQGPRQSRPSLGRGHWTPVPLEGHQGGGVDQGRRGGRATQRRHRAADPVAGSLLKVLDEVQTPPCQRKTRTAKLTCGTLSVALVTVTEVKVLESGRAERVSWPLGNHMAIPSFPVGAEAKHWSTGCRAGQEQRLLSPDPFPALALLIPQRSFPGGQ